MASRLVAVLEMIKWKHTVFALPMALAAAALAAEHLAGEQPLAWWLWRLLLVVLACFAARTAAMTHNRIADRVFDATNPRTASRPSVTGEVSPRFMWGTVAVSALAFIAIAALLNTLALILSIPFLLVLLGYNHAKRFTAAAHLWLGLALGLAPVGAWIAITGTVAWPPVILGLAIIPWVAGFDIIYALADIEHDRREGLHALPARLGAERALLVAALLHSVCFGLFVLVAFICDLRGWYLLGLLAAGSLLLVEHLLVRPSESARPPAALLPINGVFSLAIMLGILLDVWTAA
jgi:4-hydroxybenzoate polyprenyltransferase